ncbi:MAG TPA: hypothetical protein ENF54_00510 [Desulfobacteraceae bacterium]|nr:hypothetical protein [Desulfobacteraceae bacterium]
MQERIETKEKEQSYPQYPSSPYYEEDEINLLDLFIVLLKHKWLIFFMVFFAGIASVIVTLRMPNIYRSEATIVPRKSAQSSGSSILKGLGGFGAEILGIGGSGDPQKFETILKSRELTKRIVTKYHLLPVLFKEEWDRVKKRWKKNPPPTIQDAHKALMEMLHVVKDRKSDVMRIQFDSKDPVFAKEMVERFIKELSEFLREATLRDSQEKRRFFEEQLKSISDVLLKEKIYNLLAKEIEKETFTRAQKYYGFQVLDPPVVPDLNKKIKPKRRMICMVSVVTALFLSIFLAFFLEYIHNIKEKEDPERLKKLKESMKLK